MKAVAFVPIKLYNQRLPNKNIIDLNGKPVCYYIFNTLKDVNVSEVYCFCSDDSIVSYLPSHVSFLKRDKFLDKDTSNATELCTSFMQTVDADVYLMTHTTAPLIKSESINKGLSYIEEGYDSSTSVFELRQFAWYNNEPVNYNPGYITRTQDLQPILLETSGFYVYRKEVIQRGSRIGNKPSFVPVSDSEALDIDTKEDFEMVEYFLRKEQCVH